MSEQAIATPGAKALILASIDALDLDGPSNWDTTIYLDPESHALTEHAGDSTPMPAWHNRWATLCVVRQGTHAEDARSTLRDLADDLVSLAETYEGSEWSGQNHVGKWSPEYEPLADAIGDAIGCARDGGDWRALIGLSDYFAPALPDVDRRLLAGEDAAAMAEEFAYMHDDSEGILPPTSEIVVWLNDRKSSL